MKITTFTGWQLGFMITIGRTFYGEPYVTFDLPFITIQLIFKQ